MNEYNPQAIEKKWQAYWEREKIYRASPTSSQKKFYALDMFPYPSGAGLHVGHLKGYIATDVIARTKMMQNYNVLHPMGWDAFGLPAENYALKNKVHPEIAVKENIKNFKKQFEKIGFSYDWSREINTTDPDYYKWTQWVFLQMFKKGLVFQSFEPINWCPSCKTGLANEDLEQGKCERCGSEIERKPLSQWVIKITDYAERLLKDLKLLDWESSIIEMQKNWIGRSEGVEIEFKISRLRQDFGGQANSSQINVFTTRVDTIFGCTYIVIAPEHEILQNKELGIKNYEEVEKYIAKSKKKSDLERTELAKEKTGVELKGIKAINPFNNEEVSIFVSDYVIGGYGTGAVMGVPAHDERDFEFAKKYGIKITEVVSGGDVSKSAFTEDGVLINSDNFNGLSSSEAREKMADWLEEKGFGRRKINYKLRDWVFSRQRYWGEPIPLVFCPACKKQVENFKSQISNSKFLNSFNKGELLNPGWIALEDKDLPLKLPKVKNYEPTGTGESPLANIKKWVETKCPKCGGKAKRETNTMPQWAGSCWYYLAYIMREISNSQFPIFKYKKEFDNWLPVDVYVGGAEHATRHLLYARFWHKFLYDLGVVSTLEPFRKLQHVGIILAEDGRKMSKRWGNVINPDDMIKKFGADALRIYEMFMGPFNQEIAWNTQGVVGVRRFLERIWRLKTKINPSAERQKIKENKKIKIFINQTIKKVSDDIESFHFNTAISQLMILLNKLEQEEKVEKEYFEIFIKILAPFAPHFAEELWQEMGHKNSIFKTQWPIYDKNFLTEENSIFIIQINGKFRAKIEVLFNTSQKEVEKIALNDEKIKKFIAGKKIKKIIFVSNKLINFVIN